jgi:hypothetical protein
MLTGDTVPHQKKLIFISLLFLFAMSAAAVPAWSQDISLAPPPGDYAEPVEVVFENAAGYKIYYTLDGSEPSTGSKLFRESIALADDTVLRYFYQSPRGSRSPVQEGFYRIGIKTQSDDELMTVADPPGGIFDRRVRVTLTGAEGATIFYTIDGSDPGTDSPVYSSPVMLAVDTNLKYFSVGVDGSREPIREESYIFKLVSKLIDTTPPEVSISPLPDSYREGDLLRISANEETNIFYTIDEEEPDEEATLYEGPFFLYDSAVVKFIAVDLSGNRSEVRSYEYRMDSEPPSSEAFPGTGLYSPPVKVRFNVSDPDAKVYYTLSGNNPTPDSTVWDREPLIFRRDTTLKYFAMDSAGNREETNEESYFFDDEPPVTTPDPPGGEHIPPFTISLSTNEPARTFVTTDGYDPDEESPLYISNFTYIKPVTLKFFSLDRAGNRERIQTHEYKLVNGVWRRYARGVFLIPSVTDGRTFYMGSDAGLALYSVGSGERSVLGKKEGLIGNQLNDLILDEKGTLWVATEKGAAEYRGGGAFSYYTRDEGLPGTEILSLAVDFDNSVWVATRTGAGQIAGGEVVKVLRKSDGLPDNHVNAITIDLKGNRWFATRKGLAKYTPSGEWNIFTEDSGLIDDDVRTVAIDSLWNIWAGTARGLSMYDGEKWTSFTRSDGLQADNILLIAPDPDGEVWVANGGGVARYSDGEWIREESP